MSILDVLGPYKLMIEVAVIGSLALGAAVTVHRTIEAHDERVRSVVRAEFAQKMADAKDAAKVREDELRTQRDDAINKGNEREQTLRTVAAGGTAASVGLRDALANLRIGVPSATIEALRNSTTTLATVLTDCQGRYRALAEVADRHASDTKTLSDAWPVDGNKDSSTVPKPPAK